MKRSMLAVALVLAICATTLSFAGEPIDETRAAAPDGRVSIENLSGTITVEGWDRSEVSLTGTLAGDAEELEFSGTKNRTRIEVIFPHGARNLRDTESNLRVRVPFNSQVLVNGVNATIDISEVKGILKLSTVNGKITITGEPEAVQVESVNGDIRIEATTSDVEAESVSGDVILLHASGEVSVSTVSGDIAVTSGEFEEGDFSTVSGDIGFDGSPTADGSLDFESHSGVVVLLFPEDLSAEFDVSTFSGDIDNEFGPKPRRTSKYAPGKELSFTVGSGDALISISTFSGTVRLDYK